MAKNTAPKRRPITDSSPFVKLLLREQGATAEELQRAMKRAWAPSIYQLRPYASRLGFRLDHERFEDGSPMRYYFVRKPANENRRPKRAAASRTTAVATVKSDATV